MAKTIQVLPGEGRKVRVPNGPVIEHGVTTEPQTVELNTFTLRRLRDGDLVEAPAQTQSASVPAAAAIAAAEARAEAAAEGTPATAAAAARAAAAAAQNKG